MSGPFFSDPKTASLYALNPATVKLVTLPLDRIMIDAGDFSRATTTTAYFDINYDFNDKVHFKNQSFMDWMDHQKFSSYGFGAGYRPWTVENKTTIGFDLKPAKWAVIHSIAGFSLPQGNRQRGRRAQRFPGGGPPRSLRRRHRQRPVSPAPTTATGRSPISTSKPAITATPASSGSPTFSSSTSWRSPPACASTATTPDFTGRDFGETNTRATATQNATTYNASVSYRLPYHVTPYFTAATSRFLDLGQGNELDYSQVQNGTFIQTSNLYEGGVKTSLGQKLFASASVFRQSRASYNNLTRQDDYYRTTGAEFEARSYLMRRLSLTAALTWQRPGTAQRSVPARHSARACSASIRRRHTPAASSASPTSSA